MTRRAVPVAPECVFVCVHVALRCVLAPAIRRAGTATPDWPECLFRLFHITLLEHRRPRKACCDLVGYLMMMGMMTRMEVISRYL